MSAAARVPCRDGTYCISEVSVDLKRVEWRKRRDTPLPKERWLRRRDGRANESSDNRNCGDNSQEELDNIYLMLDPQLHPIAPDTSCEESVKVFEQHKQLAQDYFKVETEIAYLAQYMDHLMVKLSESEGLDQLNQRDLERELFTLENEKEALEQLHKNMKRQLEIIKKQQQKQRLGGQYGWMPEGH